MVYGIQATGDTIITDIARAVAPEDKHRNVENRLNRNLQTEGLHEKIRDASRSSKENVVTTRDLHGCMAFACNQAGIRTLREMGDESRGQKYDGQPTLPGWDELSYLGIG